MFCEQCGVKIENGKRFCSSCEERNTKIIEIPKSDILSINDEILPSKKPITASDVIKNIVFMVISIFSSILFTTLYFILFYLIFRKTEFLLMTSFLFSLIAGPFTFVLIYKLFQKIRTKSKNKISY